MNEKDVSEQLADYFEHWCGEFEKAVGELAARQRLVRYILEVHESFYCEMGRVMQDDRIEALLDRIKRIQITIKGEGE